MISERTRELNYQRQTGRFRLTARQRRRLLHKRHHQLAATRYQAR